MYINHLQSKGLNDDFVNNIHSTPLIDDILKEIPGLIKIKQSDRRGPLLTVDEAIYKSVYDVIDYPESIRSVETDSPNNPFGNLG